jgi:hypothetical protein
MTDYSFILIKNYSDKKWSMDGDSYEGLTWLDESPKPEKNTLDQEYIEYQTKYGYIAKREEAYQAAGLTPQALTIALWERLVENNPQTSDALEIIRQDIKNRYPKPSE